MKQFLYSPANVAKGSWKALAAVIAVFAVCLIPLPADAKELFVNNSGSPTCSDSTSYSENSDTYPWCTLLRAVRGNADGNRNSPGVPAQAARAGDTVYVSAGTYDYAGPAYEPGGWLSVFYDPINSGSPGAWIAFEAAGTVSLTGNRSGRSSMIGSNQAQYIKWVGFTLNQALSSYRNGIATANVDNVWFERNTIIGEYTDFGYGHDNHPGIVIHGPRDGACTGGISNITIRNNSISGWTGNNGRNDAGITLYCLGNNILIENNDIFDNQTGIYAKSSFVDNNNIVIRYNNFHDNSGDAIAMQAFSDWHVYQNIMQNNNSGFLFFNTVYYVGNTKPHDVYIVNNTMHGNAWGIYFKSLCSNLNDNHVVNNLIIGSTNTIATDNAECTTAQNLGADDVRFNWNYYLQSGHFFADDNHSRVATFSSWQSSYGQSSDSSNGINPLFIDAAGGDFRLQAASNARDAGRDVLDLDGDSSTTDPITVGAYITGNEVIGVTDQAALPRPTNLQAVQ